MAVRGHFSCGEITRQPLHELRQEEAAALNQIRTQKDVEELLNTIKIEREALQEEQILSRLKESIAFIAPIAAAADDLAARGFGHLSSALLWGFLGLTIKVSSVKFKFVDAALTSFEYLFDSFPDFGEYVGVLLASPASEAPIESFFQAYIDLGCRCVKAFRRGHLYIVGKIKWQRKTRIFVDNVRSLSKHYQEYCRKAGRAKKERSQLQEERRYQELMANQQEILSAVERNRGLVETGKLSLSPLLYPANPLFVGRSDELNEIHETLRPSQRPSRPGQRAVAICGLGGVGKSQLALQYAYQYRCDYAACFWVTCDSAVKMDGDIAKIANGLGLEDRSLAQNRHDVQEWLRNAGDEWLLILDNAENISEVFEFWPPTSGGSILLTAQDRDWLSRDCISKGIALDPLPPAESQEMLVKIMAKRKKVIEPDVAAALVETFGGLPLAIRQIGSYICATDSNPKDFLRDYQDSRYASDIDAWDESSTPWYPHTLTTFLDYPFEKLTSDAVDLLSIICFLDPVEIWEDVFMAAEGSPGRFKTTAELNDAIKKCSHYNLVSCVRKDDANVLSIHRHVQKYIKRRCSETQIKHGFEWALQGLRRTFPQQSPLAEPLSNEWPRCRLWIAHVTALNDAVSQYASIIQPPTLLAELLVDAAIYLWERGLLKEGRDLTANAMKIVETQRCDEGLMSDVYSFHACILSESGDLDQAKSYFEKQLEKQKEKLQNMSAEGMSGDTIEKIRLANAYNNLAGICCLREEYKQAEMYNELSLRIKKYWKKELNLEYLLSLSYQNMAIVHGRIHRFNEAAGYFEQALSLSQGVKYALRKALLLHNYGCMELLRNQVEKARELLEEASELREKLLGSHYDTAASLHMLSMCYQRKGDHHDLLTAKDLLESALEMLEDSTSTPYPLRIARSKFNLSIVLEALGEIDAASTQAEQAKEIAAKATNGTNIPNTEEEYDRLIPYV